MTKSLQALLGMRTSMLKLQVQLDWLIAEERRRMHNHKWNQQKREKKKREKVKARNREYYQKNAEKAKARQRLKHLRSKAKFYDIRNMKLPPELSSEINELENKGGPQR